jgi:hypothetical protein
MTDRRRRRAAHADPSHEDNPFAAPPEGRPDRPWQPRRPSGSDEPSSGGDGEGGGRGSGDDEGGQRWGSRWSPRQPGRSGGGFGGGPGQDGPEGGNGRGGGRMRGLRWDPTDPAQRHARYALHAGIWALFFSLFSLAEIALLLGALSVYWGISALRGAPAVRRTAAASGGPGGTGARGGAAGPGDVAGTDRRGDDAPGRGASGPLPVAVSPAQAAKARTTAAVSGLVTGGLALVVVASTFTLQMVYRDYYTCREDALTTASRDECTELLPERLRPFMENQD